VQRRGTKRNADAAGRETEMTQITHSPNDAPRARSAGQHTALVSRLMLSPPSRTPRRTTTAPLGAATRASGRTSKFCPGTRLSSPSAQAAARAERIRDTSLGVAARLIHSLDDGNGRTAPARRVPKARLPTLAGRKPPMPSCRNSSFKANGPANRSQPTKAKPLHGTNHQAPRALQPTPVALKSATVALPRHPRPRPRGAGTWTGTIATPKGCRRACRK
jgi:hypothetical protein